MRFDTGRVGVMGRSPRKVLDMTSGPRIPPPVDEPWKLFEVEIASTTTVRVHAGTSLRFVHGALYTTYQTVDSGSGDDPDNYATVTPSDTGFIVATLNSALAPTTLTAGYASVTPTAADETVIPIAAVTMAGGVITDVTQLHTGIWFHFWQAPDNLSLEYDTTNLLQLHGFSGALNVMTLLPTSDLFAFKSYNDGDVQYASADNIVETACANGADITGSTGTPPAHTHTWDSLTDTDGNPATAGNVGKVGVVKDIGGGTYALSLQDGTNSTKKVLLPCEDGTSIPCYVFHSRLVDAI